MIAYAFAQEAKMILPVDSFQLSSSFPMDEWPPYAAFSFQKASQQTVISIRTISGIPSVDHLPSLFCKLEYQLESKSKLAPRFRLGSLYYTEWMEGKRDYYMRYYK